MRRCRSELHGASVSCDGWTSCLGLLEVGLIERRRRSWGVTQAARTDGRMDGGREGGDVGLAWNHDRSCNMAVSATAVRSRRGADPQLLPTNGSARSQVLKKKKKRRTAESSSVSIPCFSSSIFSFPSFHFFTSLLFPPSFILSFLDLLVPSFFPSHLCPSFLPSSICSNFIFSSSFHSSFPSLFLVYFSKFGFQFSLP